MKELNADELAQVAREVTGKPHYWIDIVGTRGVFDIPENELIMIKGIFIPEHLWAPGFSGGWTSNRDQAFAVVEWLCDQSLDMDDMKKIIYYINHKDIQSLMRMVLDLKQSGGVG